LIGDSANLSRTFSSAGNRKTWTFSFWLKRTTLGAQYYIFDASGTTNNYIRLSTTDLFQVAIGATVLSTTEVFRDPGAWLHCVFAMDTGNAIAALRQRLWVNNVQQTLSGTFALDTQTTINNNEAHSIGRETGGANYLGGYLTEIHFVDGQALTPSSFGETNSTTGVWVPKSFSGSYGTNGFKLNFSDNSNTTAATLGADSSGNGLNWTPNNFSVTAGVGNDSLTDTPTNYGTDTGAGGEVRANYATLNPLDVSSNSPTWSNGNLDFVGSASASNHGVSRTTIAQTSGKFRAEFTLITVGGTYPQVGVLSVDTLINVANPYLGSFAKGYAYWSDGSLQNNASSWATVSTFTTNDVIGVELDLDNLTVRFFKNGVAQDTGARAISASTTGYCFAADTLNNGKWSCNFGQRPFVYAGTSGFKALCTQNLPTPTIIKPSVQFDIDTYVGTGAGAGSPAARTKTGVGFSPDLLWFKSRSQATDNAFYDSVRGATLQLESNTTTAETTESQGVTAFNSDGYTIGTLAQINDGTGGNRTFVSWMWNEGTILDILTYTGDGGGNRSISHSLGAVPCFIVTSRRDNTSAYKLTWHRSFGVQDYIALNTTSEKNFAGALTTTFGGSGAVAPTSTAFNVGSDANINSNGATYVAYLFAEVDGFSRIGSYTGNGSADGPFVWCGFRPKFVMYKRTDATAYWRMFDSVRQTYNPINTVSYPNDALAESTTDGVDFLSNGFKVRTTDTGANASGGTYIFIAFAENPFKYARAF